MARSSPCLGFFVVFVALTAASASTPAPRFFMLRLDFSCHDPVLTLQQMGVPGESSANWTLKVDAHQRRANFPFPRHSGLEVYVW